MSDLFSGHHLLSGEGSRQVYTVSELTYLIKGRLEEEFGLVWVEGEISGLRRAQSGHLYFTLKDENSQVRTVMFRSRLQGVRFELENGMNVLLRGQLTIYVPRGEYQIIVESLELRGMGALQLAFEQLKARLQAEGLFNEEHKRPIPFLPDRVGVVTSPTGAAVRDIINVIRRRFAGVEILIAPVRVQGEGAAEEIARAIAAMNDYGGVEVLIVGRGGGSLEDLWAFNEEAVARAIYASDIPVISAVGHEIDFTISDFVADLRAPTPSAAAELVVKNRVSLGRELRSLDRRLAAALKVMVSTGRSRLESLCSRPVLRRADYLLMSPRQRFDEAWQSIRRVMGRLMVEKKYNHSGVSGRLARFDPRVKLSGFRREITSQARRLSLSLSNSVKAKKGKLDTLAGRLHALSPLAVLGRGYSICRSLPEKKVFSDAALVSPGDEINVLLNRGEMDCRVVKTFSERKQDGR